MFLIVSFKIAGTKMSVYTEMSKQEKFSSAVISRLFSFW